MRSKRSTIALHDAAAFGGWTLPLVGSIEPTAIEMFRRYNRVSSVYRLTSHHNEYKPVTRRLFPIRIPFFLCNVHVFYFSRLNGPCRTWAATSDSLRLSLFDAKHNRHIFSPTFRYLSLPRLSISTVVYLLVFSHVRFPLVFFSWYLYQLTRTRTVLLIFIDDIKHSFSFFQMVLTLYGISFGQKRFSIPFFRIFPVCC